MAERRIINGWIYERGDDGVARRVGPAGGDMPAPLTGGNPRLPAQVQGDILGNAQTVQSMEINRRRLELDQQEFERKQREFEATHNPDGSPKPDPSKPTEYQAKSAGFLGRMLQSENEYNAAPADSRDARTVTGQWLHEWAPRVENTLPVWAGGNSPERQATDQAARNFISSSLRQESGAAINETEFARQYEMFFPQPGDTPETLRQKERARRQAIEGFRVAAGPMAPQIESKITPLGSTLGTIAGGIGQQPAQRPSPPRAPSNTTWYGAPRNAPRRQSTQSGWGRARVID